MAEKADGTPSLNELAMEAVERLVAESDTLRVRVHQDGATIIDCGIEVPGSLEAGRLVAEACMGGMGDITLTTMTVGGHFLPAVHVSTDAPLLSCLAAQMAGWNIKVGNYFALGSGPARAKACVEKLFQRLGYTDEFHQAVLVLETRQIPGPQVCKYVAEACQVELEDLYLLVAPTASMVGSVQIAARIVETAIHKLKALGLEPSRVLSGLGLCPVAPVARKDSHAMGLTNDAILAMGQTFLILRSEEGEDLERLVEKAPSSASPAYGKPFRQIFKEAGGDFYKIDRMLFAPAHITVSDLRTGRLHSAGRPDPDLFLQSLADTLE